MYLMKVTTIVDLDSFVNRIILGYCKLWPTMPLQPANAVRIRFTTGYGDTQDTVPRSIGRSSWT
jgi:hypothetical protein